MDTASKILVLGGLGNLAFGFLTGFAMARERGRSPTVNKYLNLSHMGGLMWAPILLSLVVAVNLSSLSPLYESLAAALLVAASVLLGLKDILNWLRSVDDEFVTRPFAFYLGGLSAIAGCTGLAILLTGALRAL